jgi:hypothetical protein
MQATMRKKLDANEEDMADRLEKQQKKKSQSEFMKQLTDLAQQAVEPPSTPQPEPLTTEEAQRQVNLPFLILISILLFKGNWRICSSITTG